MDIEGLGLNTMFERKCEELAQASRLPSPVLDLPYIFAKTNGLVIRQLAEGRLVFALRDDADPLILLEISHFVTLPFELEFVNAPRFNAYLFAHYGQAEDADAPSIITVDNVNAAKVIQLIDAMIIEAAGQGISDIHIEAYDSQFVVRVRQDGKLRERFKMSSEYSQAVIHQLKDKFGIDQSNPSAPQKGIFAIDANNTKLDISISTMPDKHGERMVLHLPDSANTDFVMNLPGMSPEIQSRLRQVMAAPGGMIIVAGPQDSGVTTTLYAALNQMNNGKRNIITVENSVEYDVEGINQVQIDKSTDISIAETLRDVLRQDPDVVMISQLPDRKSAEIAMKAALSGPLVLTTLQSNNAVGVITALRELKVDRMLLSESLRSVIAQRLVKRLCNICRVPAQAAGSIASRLGFDRGTGIFEPRGCAACDNSGFLGSIGVFEVVFIDDSLRRLINSGGDEAVISSHAFLNNPNLSSAARKLVISGETTAEEAIRIGQP